MPLMNAQPGQPPPSPGPDPAAAAGGMPPGEGMPPGGDPDAPPPPTLPQEAAPPGATGPTPGEGSLDEAAVEDFVDKAYQVIIDPQNGTLRPVVAQMLRQQPNDPTASLAGAGAQISAKVIAAARDAGKELDPAAVLMGHAQIVEDLGNAATQEGIYDYGPDEMSAALTQSMEQLHALTEGMGLFTQEEAMVDAGHLVEASETGEMDGIIAEAQRADAGTAGGGMAA